MLLLVFLGGVLTILSPCVLPIIPLVFARTGRSFRNELVPMLGGLAITFAVVASLATAGASWIVGANEAGRIAAFALLAVLGASLLLPRIADGATRPLVRIGAWIDSHSSGMSGVGRNVAIGAAIGLLWAPCAGPILGLVVAAAALSGTTTSSATMFLVFALGAATSLAAALLAGGRLLASMRRYLGADRWLRRALGVATLATLAVMLLGWDRELFAKGGVQTTGAEQLLIARLGAGVQKQKQPTDIGISLDEVATRRARMTLADEGKAPRLDGATAWINSAPLDLDSLKGKVVLVQFWTFACYNCLNALPHVKALEAKYRDRGFVVIGVHTPELPHEKVEANVRREVRDLGITYPVAVDNDYRIWNAFGNQFWPAAYFIDATGRIRFHHFGEGRYEEQDQVVETLLAESHAK